MAILRFGPDTFFIVASGLSQNPDDHLGDDRHMSYEFAMFLKKWEMGDVGRTPFHLRNYKIATRKSCYSEPLFNNLGIFTDKGQEVLARAKSLLGQVYKHYESLGLSISDVPAWDQCTAMDSIVLVGKINTRNIAFLRTMYNQMNPIDYGNFAQLTMEMPTDMEFTFRKHNGIDHLVCTPLRNFPRRRQDLEVLVKYGLVELTNLPKLESQHGRGRAPVGAALTRQGWRFFEHFLDLNDPQRIAAKERKAELNLSSPNAPNMSNSPTNIQNTPNTDNPQNPDESDNPQNPDESYESDESDEPDESNKPWYADQEWTKRLPPL